MYSPASFASASASVGQLPEPLRSRWQASGLPESSLSLVIAEVGQPPIVAINPMQPRNPASVMKLITTYAALEGLGPGHTWRTELLTGANAMPLPDGRLPGPLYVRASGDPHRLALLKQTHSARVVT
nr:D-alanyl-D-alanine carboxypeptidase [Pseudomonas sp.]